MKKTKIDRAVEVALDRLSEELRQKSGSVNEWYLFGYVEAISDFLWDYTGVSLGRLKMDDYDARVMRLRKATENSPIKKIKLQEVKNETGKKANAD